MGLRHTKMTILLISTIIGISALAYSQFTLTNVEHFVRWRFVTVPQLSTSQLADWLDDNERGPPVLLDVRTREEYEVSHLAGARWVDPDTDPNELLRQLDTNQDVVMYCAVGYRSSKLAAKLIRSGHQQVWNLEGSIFAWAKEHRPLVNDGKPTTDVHRVNKLYALLR